MNHFKRYKELFNQDLEQYEHLELKTCIRINTLKITTRKLLNRLQKKRVTLQKIHNLDNGYRMLKSPFSLASTPEYLLGYYYIQEAASQLPVQLLDPKPGELVLDMAAAPGGKTTQLAQYMQNQGAIIAIDTKTRRLQALTSNINRLGVTNCIVYNKDARYVDDYNIKFDKVLLDAPCSGNFMIDKTWGDKQRNIDDFKEKAKEQKQLLKAGINALKSGGFLTYSTCSLEPEENEEVIDWAEKNLPVKVVQMHRLWPPEYQGFFAALLRKK